MAKRVQTKTAAKPVDARVERTNPDLFGEDVAKLAVAGAGSAITAFVNDQVFAPFLNKIMPGSIKATVMGKMIEAGTTACTAFVISQGVALVDKGSARDLKQGGLILATARGISALLPGYGMTATVPSWSFLHPTTKPVALPAASTTTSSALTPLGVGKMGI